MTLLESILRTSFLVLALLGLPVGFIFLCRAISAAHLPHPPYFHFFLIFGAVGGLCLWFAFLSSTPVAFMISVIPVWIAPLGILISSCFLYRRRRDSRFHAAAFISGIVYVCLIISMFLLVVALHSTGS
ncbi:MAG: hypothetical protein QOD99_2498 [Chthoniobacter sp.]|jgi:drug/metabolite transporter (DMT)-like permease|nr:hypothetical protein [Chthoniobacter sp.]